MDPMQEHLDHDAEVIGKAIARGIRKGLERGEDFDGHLHVTVNYNSGGNARQHVDSASGHVVVNVCSGGGAEQTVLPEKG